MAVLAGLYRTLKPRAGLFMGLCLAVVVAAALFASRLVIREDAATLLPERPRTLVDQFAVLRDAPFLRGLAITLGGPDPTGAADTLARALRGPDFSFVYAGGPGFPPASLARMCRLAPGLMTEDSLAALPGLVTEDAVRSSLARDARLLLTPRGLALRDMLALDPLGICAGTLASLAPARQDRGPETGGPSGAAGPDRPGTGGAGTGEPEAVVRRNGPRLENGRLLSADGKYALVLAEPAAPVGDSLAAAAAMNRVRDAVAALPEGTVAVIAGGHRHTEENAATIKGDLFRVLPVSLILLAALYLVFVRSRQGATIVALPAASLAVAAALAGFFQGSLSGIALGFGSVVLGITADYAIHVYFAVRCGREAGESVQRVSGPLLLGAATTLAAFAAFGVSGIPCIRQMAALAVCGILAALVLALTVLPLCVSPVASIPFFDSARRQPQPATATGPGRVYRIPALLPLWAALTAALAVLFSGVSVDGDIRNLSSVSEANARDEAFTRDVWGGLRGGALAAVRGASLEEALRKNDGLYADLARLAAERDQPKSQRLAMRDVTSLAPMLPSGSLQAERHAAWSAFWRDNAAATLERLDRLAPGAGFAPSAFAPFAAWIASPPAPVRADDLTGMGLALPHLLLRTTADGAYAAYTLLPSGKEARYSPTAAGLPLFGPSGEPAGAFAAVLERNGAVYASGETFRAAVDAATRDDLVRFGGLSLAAILLMTALALRSPARMGIALLPVGAGLLAVLGVFRLLGMSLNIFHAMALPLVMALSVDYGIFVLARLEGVLGPEATRGVLLSGLSTLTGFGALLLARHPALFSLGLSVSLGLAASLLTALVLLPRLGALPGAVQKSGREERHA